MHQIFSTVTLTEWAMNCLSLLAVKSNRNLFSTISPDVYSNERENLKYL